MTLDPREARRILTGRYGAPVKDVNYALGFKNRFGRVLALRPGQAETRIWFQPPAPPSIPGIEVLPRPNNGNADITGPIKVLKSKDTKRVLIQSSQGLHSFLDWYDSVTISGPPPEAPENERIVSSKTSQKAETPKPSSTDTVAREKSIADIKYSVGKTVFNSNGQIVPRQQKDKQLRMTDDQLEKKIRELLDIQGDQCAITGIPFQFQGAHEDSNLLPSLDRIDSDGHYEAENLQLVCRFINFWKQAADDKEFRRLIMLVRGQDA